jgi:hypothetical protein
MNFDSYKKDINKVFFDRDEEETRRLNESAQPKIIYNNFPLVLISKHFSGKYFLSIQ